MVTAASCLKMAEEITPKHGVVLAIVGEHNFCDATGLPTIDTVAGQSLPATKVHVHPQFELSKTGPARHDIALVEVTPQLSLFKQFCSLANPSYSVTKSSLPVFPRGPYAALALS